MNKFYFFLLIMLSVIGVVSSQTIPEEYMHRAYHFSFVEEKKEDIKLKVKAKERDSPYYKEGKWEKIKTQKGKDVFFELHQSYPTSRGNTFVFSKLGQQMEIRTTSDLYSIPFVGGRYNIPQSFAPLFQIQEGKSKILNKDIRKFKVEEWADESDLLVAKANIPEGMDFTTQVDRVGQSKYFIAGADTEVFLYLHRTNMWRKFDLPLSKEQHYIEHVSAGDKSILFATIYDRKAKEYFVMYSKNGGDSWKRHKVLSSLEVDWIKMYNKKIGYALGRFNDDYTAFYATENGGKNWTRVYEIKGSKHIILDILSPKEIIIRNESDYNYPIYYKSKDGGESWEISKEHNDIDFFDQDILFHNDLFSRKGRKEKAQLIFPSERRVHFNFIKKDDKYKVILVHNYILYSTDSGGNWIYFPIEYGRINNQSYSGNRYLKGGLSKLFFIDEKTLLYFNNRTLFEINIP